MTLAQTESMDSLISDPNIQIDQKDNFYKISKKLYGRDQEKGGRES